MIDVAWQRDQAGRVHVDLDTLATAPYVKMMSRAVSLRAEVYADRVQP